MQGAAEHRTVFATPDGFGLLPVTDVERFHALAGSALTSRSARETTARDKMTGRRRGG